MYKYGINGLHYYLYTPHFVVVVMLELRSYVRITEKYIISSWIDMHTNSHSLPLITIIINITAYFLHICSLKSICKTTLYSPRYVRHIYTVQTTDATTRYWCWNTYRKKNIASEVVRQVHTQQVHCPKESDRLLLLFCVFTHTHIYVALSKTHSEI